MTAEQLEELLGKVTQGEWRLGVYSEVYAEGGCDTWITVGTKNYDAVAIVVNENIKSDAEEVFQQLEKQWSPDHEQERADCEELMRVLDDY